MWSRPQMGVCVGQSVGPSWKPHSHHAHSGHGFRSSHFVSVHMPKAGRADACTLAVETRPILCVCTPGGGWRHRVACPSKQVLQRNTQQLLSRGSAPVSPTSHCSLEPDLGLLLQQLGSKPYSRQGCNNQRGSPTQYPVQALVTTAPNTPLIKGTMASTL